MSPRTTEANDLVHADRRTKILGTALDVFAARGYEGTRMQAIAEGSGFSYGLVYHYFPSKDAIFTVLVHAALDAASGLISNLPKSPVPATLSGFAKFAIGEPSPKYFALIIEALTKEQVPAEISQYARTSILRLEAELAGIFDTSSPVSSGQWKAPGFLALLLGTSIMRSCGISDGAFIGEAAALFADTPKER